MKARERNHRRIARDLLVTGVVVARDDFNLLRSAELQGVDRQLDPFVGRGLDARERFSVAEVVSKVLAKITENERAEETRVELRLAWPACGRSANRQG
jgi:hypothetical protein